MRRRRVTSRRASRHFARDVLFNPKTTTWQLSYDGRNKEPITLPAKFPIVLLEGADGIAVGLSTKILPHNFNDLCRAAINHLQGKTFRILPDFPTGGTADFSEYNDGERGGKVKVRAKIEDAQQISARGHRAALRRHDRVAHRVDPRRQRQGQDQGQARRRQHRRQGRDPRSTSRRAPSRSKVIQQLYVFTSCQVQLNPAACVIVRDRQDRRRQAAVPRRPRNPQDAAPSRPGSSSSASWRSSSANSSSSGTGIRSSAFSSRSASTGTSKNRRRGKACSPRSAAA